MKKSFLAFICILAFITVSNGQERPNHEIHAAMLYNFIKYV